MSKKEQLIQAKWIKGYLNHKLRPHQVPVYNKIWEVLNGVISDSTYVINCARRFGKSFILVLVAIEFAIRNPGAQIRYAIPIAVNYTDMLMPSINVIIEDAPEFQTLESGEHVKFIEHLKSEKRITFGNGSMIKFAGTDSGNAEALRGNASDLNILDEAGYMTSLDYVYRSILFPQVLTTNGKTLFSSTPPATADHDFVTYYRDHKERGLVSEFTIYDNSSLDEEQIATAAKESGGVDSVSFRREFLCHFVTDEELKIIPNWLASYEQDYPRSEFFPFYHKYLGLDSGVRDLTCCLLAYYDFENARLIVEDEVTMNGPSMTTDMLAKEIKAKITALNYSKIHRYIADNNNLQLIQDLSITHRLYFTGVKKTDLDAMVNRVRIMVGQGKIIVNPRCKQLLGCLSFGVWKDKAHIGEMFGRSSTYGHWDALAALIYLAISLDTRTNPIPALLNVDVQNSHIPKAATQQASENSKKLQTAFYPNRRHQHR